MLKTDSIQERVDLVVERQWHVGSHAKALAQKRWLGTLYGGFPKFRYVGAGVPAQNICSHSSAVLWNHFVRKIPGGSHLHMDEPKALARWVAGKRDLNRFVVCYATAYQYLFPMLQGRGHVLILERGSTHPLEYWERLKRASAENGLPYPDQPPKKLLEEVAAGQLAHFVGAGSKLIADSYVRRGFDPRRILLVPYGVDHGFFASAEREPNPSPLRVACVGIIGLRKGLPRLIRIARWAEARGLKVEILLVGPLQAEAPSMLAKAPGNVHSLGVKKGADLVRLLQQCHLYCLPSYEEGFGISVLEAMSTGLPAVISTDTGAREAVIHGASGLVLGTFSEDELDTELAPLLRDSELRHRMGRSARETIESQYTLAHYSRTLASEYQRMFDIVTSSKSK